MTTQIGAGAGYRVGRCRFDVAYALDPKHHAMVQRSALLAGEYSDSQVRAGNSVSDPQHQHPVLVSVRLAASAWTDGTIGVCHVRKPAVAARHLIP